MSRQTSASTAIAAAVFVAAAVFAAGACTALDLSSLRFHCTSNNECGREKVCDRVLEECVAPDQLSEEGDDAGASDADVDAGIKDAGPRPHLGVCAPTAEATTIDTLHWWCRNMSAEELHPFVDRFGARVLDLEIEPGSGGLFSAALERKHDGRRTMWTEEIAEHDLQSVFDQKLEFADVNPLREIDGQLYFAAMFEEFPGARFWNSRVASAALSANARALLDGRGWFEASGFYPRIVYLSRWLRDGEEYFTFAERVRGIAHRTAVEYGLDAIDIEARATTGRVLDVEKTDISGRYTVVTATRTPTDRETHFVGRVSPDELDERLEGGTFYVWRLAVEKVGIDTRWSALIVSTPTSAETRLAARISDESLGRQSFILANTGGSTVAAVDPGAKFRMSRIGTTLVALYAIERLQAGEVSLERTEVPNYVFPSESNECPGGRPVGTSTLGHALDRMLNHGGFDAMRGLVAHFGQTELNAYAQTLGLTDTMLSGTVGCTSDRSTTTIADQVRLFRAMTRVLDAEHRDLLYHMMPGPNPDASSGWDASALLSEVVAEEVKRLGLAESVKNRFRAELAYRVVHTGIPKSGTVPDTSFLISADIPHCVGGQLETETWMYGAALIGVLSGLSDGHRDPDRALLLQRVELLREPIRNALSSLDCLP